MEIVTFPAIFEPTSIETIAPPDSLMTASCDFSIIVNKKISWLSIFCVANSLKFHRSSSLNDIFKVFSGIIHNIRQVIISLYRTALP